MKVKNQAYLANQIPQTLQRNLINLPAGQSFEQTYTGTLSIETFRNRVYSFLHHEGIKSQVKVTRQDSTLTYTRLSPCQSTPLTDFTRIEDLVLKHLINLPTGSGKAATEQVKTKLFELLTQGLLTEAEFFPALHEWERISGAESAKENPND